ncbi:hypothetical protein JG687_00001024 [Phytophthora cactorum]|uniref:Uncharacterized protein n=1 Tax=Phytophthora cactorum TaxID=29920 RepID=A0A8T1UZA2_9STRA|nr:hypothetical protein JG687_00001024 [Phytophthora cactorum]
MGMPKDLVDRLYRALYVYTNGFHNIINEIAAHCPPRFEKHVSSNAWLTFLLLLEQCENGKYEMAMLKFKQAAENTQNQLQDDFQQEKQYFNAQLHITESALKEETSRGNEKSELILKLVTETTESNLKMAEQQHQIAAQAEHIRLLKLEVLVHEDEEKKLNELLDDTRRDYEVANSERLNALSERYALDEEIRKLSSQLERVEAEKANYAKRMHETLFMNQALRANNDQLKQDLVVQGMEKDKVIVEKQGLQEQVEKMREEICRLQELKAQVDKELIETQRKQSHLEARFQTVKEQFDIEAENSAKHQQEIVRLAAQNDEERVQVGVLEAKCNLLAAEKQNTGMRAQDKLRIERLLNQKMELEAIVEANKVDKKKDEEQIWTLRTSLEALDNELQHNKRVYSAGQQAFLHSERTCEQLRLQNQELEKNYEKTKKNVMSLKERFKVYETAAKEQITKLEVEVKVANAQLREITYVNKDNVAQIEQLTKTLSLSEREATVLRTHIKESEMHVVELQTEKEDLQRNQNEQALANSTSKNAVTRFILSLQNMLALVKLDEFPLDEAIRELLLMIQDTFGEELNIENVLGEDDKPVEIELEVQEDVTDEERTSRQKRADARRQGIISIEGCDDDDEEEAKEASEDAQREIIRMSRFRKSKLDHLVNKLQRDIALKADLIANLESVVVEQNRQISQLTTTTRQQSRVIMQVECQKGMLQSDLEMTTLSLFEVRAEKRAVEFTLDQVRIDHVLRANRAFQVEVALATLRREFDMQVIVYEDLMGKIGRKYEHDEYMRSLRRNKEVQASVTGTTMTDLVAAIAPACSITDDSAGCYTASWFLIWDQVRYWLLIQMPVIALSIVYEWLELASHKYIERLRKICDSPLTNVVNYLVQLVTSFYVCINWIVRGGSLTVSFSSWSIESLFLIATGVGYGIRWLAAKNKVTYVLQLHNLFDLLSVVAHFTISFQTVVVGTKRLRSWLDFGFIRSYVGYVVVDHLFARYPNKTFFSQVLLVVFKALCLVFFFAAVLFSLEQLGELPHTNSFLLHVYECSNEDGTETILRATSEGTDEYPNCNETWSFFSSIYFMFVTVSTVGYGDFSPHTVLGQLTVCVIIVFGIYTFANESAAFMTLYGDQRGTLVKYDGSRNTVHVIVTGNPSVAQTKDFIREFFHPDHEEAFQGHDSDSDDSDDEVAKLVAGQSSTEASHSRSEIPLKNHVRYGSIHEAYTAMEEGEVSKKKDKKRDIKPLVSKWMHRGESLIRETHIVVLMQFDKAGENASYQREVMEFVEQNPRYHKRVFLVYGSPLRETDLKNAQLDRAMAVFFLPNKYSDDGNKEDAATVLRVLSVSQQKQEHTQLFAMLANSDNRTLLEATGLSKENLVCADEIRLGLMGLSCRCPGLSTVVSNLITSRSGEIPEAAPEQAHLLKPWVSEYISGAANEIYSCCLTKHFHGMNFIQATMHVHRQSNGLVLLIAVESDGEIAFNPGRWYRITPSTKAYLIAESISSLEPFAGTPTMSSVAALSTNMALLQSRGNLLSRARQAQHNVERRIPRDIREYIMRCAANDDPSQIPSSPSRDLLSAGGHVVVCSNIGNESGGQRSVSRLVNFLRPLRAPHIERIVPVVIVDAGTFDSVSWLQLRDFGEVYHVHGSPQNHHVLAAAGIYTASSIVVLAQGNEAGYDDSKAIFNAILVNSALQRNKIFTIIELRDVNNNRFLDPVSSFGSSRRLQGGDFMDENDGEYDVKSHLSSYRGPLSSGVRESVQYSRASTVAKKQNWVQRKAKVVKHACSAVNTFFLGSLKTAAQQVSTYGGEMDNATGATIESLYNGDGSETFFQERFMNGALFPSYVADDLLIQSFFNPSLNMFIRKILDGKSCFVLYDVPKELRERKLLYGELFENMTSGVAHTLPIGLLRAKGGPGGAPYPYVYTCPSSDTIVYPGDKIFVLINVMALNRLANKLQRRFRNRSKPSMTLADLVETISRPSQL